MVEKNKKTKQLCYQQSLHLLNTSGKVWITPGKFSDHAIVTMS